MDASQVKALFRQRGMTFTCRAEENGYSRNAVYRVLNGQTKSSYGKAHEITVRLGLKSNTAAA